MGPAEDRTMMQTRRAEKSRSLARPRTHALALLLGLAMLVCGAAQAGVQTSVNGNTVTSSVSLSGIDADLTLSFTEVENLSVSALGLRVKVLGLFDLLRLVRQLLALDLDAVLASFPVQVAVDPAGLEFANTVLVEVHTHELQWAPGTRLRLFKSEHGGPYFDITEAVEPGSVRARGRTGGFSQFMILQDDRPTSQVVNEKYDRIANRLEDAAAYLDASQEQGLHDLFDASRSFADAGDFASAIASLELFDAEVRQLSGTVLPNRWSSSGGLDNVGGDLQAGASTLRFSLGYLRDHGN